MPILYYFFSVSFLLGGMLFALSAFLAPPLPSKIATKPTALSQPVRPNRVEQVAASRRESDVYQPATKFEPKTTTIMSATAAPPSAAIETKVSHLERVSEAALQARAEAPRVAKVRKNSPVYAASTNAPINPPGRCWISADADRGYGYHGTC